MYGRIIPIILPGNNGTTGAVRDQRGVRLEAGRGADGLTTESPPQSAVTSHVLGVEVCVEPGDDLLPRDHRPTGTIRGDGSIQTRIILVVLRDRQADAGGTPQGDARTVDALGIDVVVCATASVYPGDNCTS